ncbi:uncharacterized protein K444DRAFT_520190 [Hyaloscypha bicolor E]|uniref:Uncharacterized protein n=1 Tax=Hyaloscypha bicolor E TaxID=1095630 RepID=A0A2J6TQ45_9HELO|nr:uncharacterized protein K444DRAFT_520190 [Hyaloscypha bicolor E]PMD65143.1 hypothetical protein K444DRAFT_520190 [Hyaloscypha bicolor E]
MTWLSVLGSVLYYLSLPFTTVFTTVYNWVLIALAPALHLGHYLFSGMLLPLRLLAKFETLYIYLGVAAVIGLLTGSILHMSSSILVSIFNLTPTPEEIGRSAASVRAAREKKKLEQAWQSSTTKVESGKWKGEPSTDKKYSEWLEIDRDLLRQTILEEDDDSEEGF